MWPFVPVPARLAAGFLVKCKKSSNRYFARCKTKRSVEMSGLRPGSGQAGGGDRDDLGQPSSDPGRRAAQKFTYLSHLSSSIGAGGTIIPGTGRTMENGPTWLRCRDVYENSNARFVGEPFGSEFITAIAPATRQIFSANRAFIIP